MKSVRKSVLKVPGQDHKFLSLGGLPELKYFGRQGAPLSSSFLIARWQGRAEESSFTFFLHGGGAVSVVYTNATHSNLPYRELHDEWILGTI
jgi:hypothetical protein